jgi:adenylate cyclase
MPIISRWSHTHRISARFDLDTSNLDAATADGGNQWMTAGQTSCRTCGTEPRVGARFCDACGSPIVQPESTSEYKQVTVLFADVVRSMDLAAVLDSERLREVMGELFNRCGAIVKRFGGTVDKFTGDGIMALFGAPIALEDHAARACHAAVAIQHAAVHLATDVHRRDGVTYAVRVGLNSGEVVTGQIGSQPTSYTAVGAHVGMAQRMESVAPPGGVMVSESTARLVAHTATLGDPQMVEIKGAAAPVPARLLLAMEGRRWETPPSESSLIGREREVTAVDRLLDAAIAGTGSVIGIVGPAGIGKSRVALGLSGSARLRSVETFSTFCESHAAEIPFHVVGRLLRNVFAIDGVDASAARSRIRDRLPLAEPDDLDLLDDLLGLRVAADPGVSTDARRRRLSQLLTGALTAWSSPTVFVVEDAHWIDDASEAVLADAFAAVPKARALAVVTYRPEYLGVLLRVPGLQTFTLAPLDDSQSSALAAELVGSHPSVRALREQIVLRAAGNPFFVHEIVRDLAERNVIEGHAGAYVCHGDPADAAVPATLQATIAARIDRLPKDAKRALNAAALIGSQFSTDLLATLLETTEESIQASLTELVTADLVDPVVPISSAGHAFRHPLIQAVARESQLKTVRARLHRRLADTIRLGGTGGGDENAALIGTHLEAAGDLREAHAWYMRAGTWYTNRDIGAARTSWQRARRVADQLPSDEPDRTAKRIAPRSLLCGSSWRAGGSIADTGFDELRSLCTDDSTRIPLALGMAGFITALGFHARTSESAQLATEYVRLVESIGDATFTVGTLFAAIHTDYLIGAMSEVQRLAQRVIDLADGDPTKGNFLTGSPLAFATSMRGIARCCLGLDGWLTDFDQANAIAREVDPTTYVSTVMFKYTVGIAGGALIADETALRETREALETARRCSEDLALGLAQVARGVALVRTGSADDRTAGLELLSAARALTDDERFPVTEMPIIDAELAAERTRTGDLDGAVELARRGVDAAHDGLPFYLGSATTVLVTALLQRGGSGDTAEAHRAVDRLAHMRRDPGTIHHELPLLRLRSLLAADAGDASGYRQYTDRYRARAVSLGFAGHMAIAEALAESRPT